jgi:hypothetical protein
MVRGYEMEVGTKERWDVGTSAGSVCLCLALEASSLAWLGPGAYFQGLLQWGCTALGARLVCD